MHILDENAKKDVLLSFHGVRILDIKNEAKISAIGMYNTNVNV